MGWRRRQVHSAQKLHEAWIGSGNPRIQAGIGQMRTALIVGDVEPIEQAIPICHRRGQAGQRRGRRLLF